MDSKTVVRSDVARQVLLSVTPKATESKVLISGGQFRIGKTEYTLPEEFVYNYTTIDKPLTVYFYLMKKKSDNTVVVMVDEIEPNELPLSMMDDKEYEYLWQIASLKVPANAPTLEQAKLTIFHSDTETKPRLNYRGRN